MTILKQSPEVLYKKTLLKNIAIFTGKYLCWSFRPATLLKRQLLLKLVYYLRNLQTSRENNSRILRIKNAKFPGIVFYMNTNIYWDFQICISVSLTKSILRNICERMLLTIFQCNTFQPSAVFHVETISIWFS